MKIIMLSMVVFIGQSGDLSWADDDRVSKLSRRVPPPPPIVKIPPIAPR